MVHAAVMQRLRMNRVISPDTDYDRMKGIDRLDPARTEEWQDSILTSTKTAAALVS